jgi:hypothetical protein
MDHTKGAVHGRDREREKAKNLNVVDVCIVQKWI